MAEFDELKDALRNLITNMFAPKPAYTRGLLGDGLGNVQVPDKPDHSYVRFSRGSNEFFEVFNRLGVQVDGWPVLIGELPWQPGLTQVVDTDWSAYQQSGWGDSIGATTPHALTHEWPDGAPGADPMSVYLRSIVPGRAYVIGSGSTTVFVNAFDYEYLQTGTSWTGLPGIDLSPIMSAMVTGNARLMGLYLNPPTNSLVLITGTQDVFTQAFDPPAPAFPSAVLPIARIRVYGGQAGLKDVDIRDARRLFSLAPNDRLSVRTTTVDYTLTTNDDVLLVDASATGTIAFLPSALGNSGIEFSIKKIDNTSNPVRVTGTQTIDDTAAMEIIFQYDAMDIISDGLEWWIV